MESCQEEPWLAYELLVWSVAGGEDFLVKAVWARFSLWPGFLRGSVLQLDNARSFGTECGMRGGSCSLGRRKVARILSRARARHRGADYRLAQ
jgi:hypothetical protein